MSKHRILSTLSLEERKESSSRKATCECLLQAALSLPDSKPETPHFFILQREHTTYYWNIDESPTEGNERTHEQEKLGLTIGKTIHPGHYENGSSSRFWIRASEASGGHGRLCYPRLTKLVPAQRTFYFSHLTFSSLGWHQ